MNSVFAADCPPNIAWSSFTPTGYIKTTAIQGQDKKIDTSDYSTSQSQCD
ncbi:hypothetical protein SynA1528_02116 [Synechococcus sp. A15-28]|nr:hypothetical protein SynA1528_02116 [Synechococcus sp. A15-28]